jgi:hypothetical protein
MPEKSISILIYGHHELLDLSKIHIKFIAICKQTFAKGAKLQDKLRKNAYWNEFSAFKVKNIEVRTLRFLV